MSTAVIITLVGVFVGAPIVAMLMLRQSKREKLEHMDDGAASKSAHRPHGHHRPGQ